MTTYLIINLFITALLIIILDMDECTLFDKICPDGSQCINTVGSYTCICAVGYYHFRNETDNTTLCTGIHNYYSMNYL